MATSRTNASAVQPSASVEEWEPALEEYLEENNKQPKPFIWTATVVEQILAKVHRCIAILEAQHSCSATWPRASVDGLVPYALANYCI